MSLTDGTGLFGELAWILQRQVSDTDSRREIYEHMIDAFADLGWYDRDQVLGNDPILDDVIAERDEVIDEDPPEEDEE